MWLLLCSNISERFKFNKKYTYLLELNKINILVGKNNSGKSYLMREIIRNTIRVLNREEIKEMVFNEKNFKNIEMIYTYGDINSFNSINKRYINILKQIERFDRNKIETGRTIIGGRYTGKVYQFTDFSKLKEDSEELIEYLGFDLETDYGEFSNRVIRDKRELVEKVIKEYKDKIYSEYDNLPNEYIYQFGKLLYDFGYVNDYLEEYKLFYNPSNETCCFKNYIPLLRNIRHPLKSTRDKNNCNTDNIFKNRILDEYNYEENEVNVITGLDFYFEYKEKLLGTKYERGLISEFEKFLSNYFFEGKEISIIPDEKTYELKVNIQDSEDRFIYQVGDGITSLIIIMYNIYMYSDIESNIFFIEEPEQSFHPGFQRLFTSIISLNDKFKNCYFSLQLIQIT